MSLSDIKEKLYKKNSEESREKELNGSQENLEKIIEKNEDTPAKEIKEENREIKQENPNLNQNDLWENKEEKKKKISEEKRKILKKGIWIIGSILGIILVAVIFFGVRAWLFGGDKTTVSISGPEQARSGKLLTYEIIYKNDNLLTIKNARLTLFYPESLKPDENPNFKEESVTKGSFYLGDIKPHSEGRIVFNAKAYSPKGALIYLKAGLSYQPSGFSSRFEALNQIGINVISTPITLEIQAPQNATSGDAMDYLVNFRNDGEEAIDGLKIRVEYPEGFSFTGAQPTTSEENNIWYIGSLDPGESGKILINGKISGEMNNVRKAKVMVGVTQKNKFVVLNEETVETKIVAAPFSISQKVNGQEKLNANAGDTLKFDISFKNNSDIGLSDVVITEKLNSQVLDYSTLDMPGGNFDSNEKTIIWKASDIPSLANLSPGAGGTISFSVKVKEKIPVSSPNDKNFVISSLAKIDSPDVPTPISMNKIVSSNKLNVKLNSKVILETLGFYNDSNISNSGPVPPKVDQETTYTLHWKITNISNDLTGAKITATLPTNAVATGKVYPEDAKITYNERSNSITWDIGEIPAGVGILKDTQEAAFQVKIKPFPSQVGREVGLLGQSTLTAKDAFTGETYEKISEAKTTNLFEDGSLTGEGKVVN